MIATSTKSPIRFKENSTASYITEVNQDTDLPELKQKLLGWHQELPAVCHFWVKCSDWIYNPQPNWSNEWAERYHHKRSLGFSEKRYDGTNYNPTHDIKGGVAEDYVCRLLGGKGDRSLLATGDNQDFSFVDVVDGKTRTVDVKWSSWVKENVYLKLNPNETLKDIYVLVTGDSMNIRGIATRKQASEAKLIDWGYGPKRSLPANVMYPFSQLVERAGWIQVGDKVIASLLALSGWLVVAAYADGYLCIKEPFNVSNMEEAIGLVEKQK